ncbi:hypothetical protein [Microcystis phage Me-ZS1]|nr:hypothetical protein [Microcystis phage Me-ZS1]
MPRRFGRNQKRAMRARVAALEAQLAQARSTLFAPWGEAPADLPDLEADGAVRIVSMYDTFEYGHLWARRIEVERIGGPPFRYAGRFRFRGFAVVVMGGSVGLCEDRPGTVHRMELTVVRVG